MEEKDLSEEIKRIGKKLRELRLRNNPQKLTLHEVSEAVGYSVATLSQIERGIIAPSIQGLLRLADFYKVSPASFFETETDKSVSVSTQKTRQKIKGDFGEVFEVLHNYIDFDTIILRGIIPPGSSSGSKLHERDYSEFVYVCGGTLKVVLADGEYLIKPGDSVFIRANTPFRLMVHGNEVLEGIFIYFGKRK